MRETSGPEDATRHLTGELWAPWSVALGSALESVLRDLTTFSVLMEAALEVVCSRPVAPKIASSGALVRVAHDLLEAGYAVRLAPSWCVAPEADVWVGTGGAKGGIECFLRSCPSWKLV